MKKLIMVAAVMAAVAANAATFSWKTTTTGKIYQAGTTTLLTSATAYLFDAGKVSQSAVIAAFVAGTDISTLAYADTTTVTSGALVASTFDVPDAYNEGDAFAGYFALVVDSNIYIGPTSNVNTPATGDMVMSFNAKTSSQTAALDTKDGYSGAGWYATSTSPIPEPTSGILMLLGFAGLALRRRRA